MTTGQFPKRRESEFTARLRRETIRERIKGAFSSPFLFTRDDYRTARKVATRGNGGKAWYVPGTDQEIRTPHATKELRRRRRATKIAKASRAAQRRAAAVARRKRQKRRTYSR